MADAYSTLLIERCADGYAVVTLNRPEALNALNSTLFGELAAFLDAVETDDSVRCLILTGSAKAFAAGADIKEMADQSYADMFKGNFFALGHDRITRFRKPIIAAVAGRARGRREAPRMTPPPPATAVADMIAPPAAWRDSKINADILSPTWSVTWPYFVLLGLGISGYQLFRMLRKPTRKPWTRDRWIAGDILAAYCTLQFFGLIHIFMRPASGGTVGDLFRLFLIGFGIELPR